MKIWNKLRGIRGIEWMMPLALLVLVMLVMLRENEGGARNTAIEARLAQALSWVKGAGEVRVVIYDEGDEIEGVLIVAEGAEDLRVRLEIGEAAHAVLGVDLERIEVMDMKEE